MIQNIIKHFSIEFGKDGITIQQVDKAEMYSGKGIYRAARVPNNLSDSPLGNNIYEDNFKLDVKGARDQQGKNIKTRRLFQLFEQETDLFPRGQSSSFISEMEIYPTFLTQCGLIDKNFLKSLFFNQKVNRQGYYKYFVMRDGQYFVETVDDQIPVDQVHQMPIWIKNTLYPWQLILMKAWIKQKKGFHKMIESQPFQFLNSFGFPSYKVFNFKKQIQFIQNENITKGEKQAKMQALKINSQNYVIIGQTRHSNKIDSLGLQQNRVGYLITPTRQKINNQAQIFRVESAVNSKWVGEMSLIADSTVNSKFNPKLHNLTLERSFLIKRKDLLQIFKKYYLAPKSTIFQQNCLNFSLTLKSDKSHQLLIQVAKKGKMNIKIQMPSSQQKIIQGKIRYPKIKYFISKERDKKQQQGARKFPSRPELKSRLDINTQEYSHSSTHKYEHFDIEYGHGCHKSINQFISVQKGNYVLHVKIQKSKPFYFNIFFSTTAEIKPIIEADFQQQDKNQFFESTFYSIGVAYNTQVNIVQSKNAENQSIRIGNFFNELGYGFVSITTKIQAKYHLAMRVFPKKMKQAGYMIKCKKFNKQLRQKALEIPLTFISQKGFPEIAVFRAIRKVQLQQRFPPQGCIQFYRITEINPK